MAKRNEAYENPYTIQKRSSPRIYLDRASRCDRDHRHPGRHAAARVEQGKEQSPRHPLLEQQPADDVRLAVLRRRQRWKVSACLPANKWNSRLDRRFQSVLGPSKKAGQLGSRALYQTKFAMELLRRIAWHLDLPGGQILRH